MAAISAKAHGILDYATGVAVIAAPGVLRIHDRRATAVLLGVGAGMIGGSAITDHEAALVRKLPMPVHLLGDLATGIGLSSLSLAMLRRRAGFRNWAPHAVLGIGAVAGAALTERQPADRTASAPADAEAGGPQADPVDETIVAREESAAAAEAARIGGPGVSGVADPAMDPVYQAGGGEQEGWEAAEAELIENATHGDGHGDPLGDAFTPEVESDLSGAAYGESDGIRSTEIVEEGDEGP